MSSKFFILLGMTVGSIVGGYLPGMFGAGLLSFIGILGSGVGGILGIFLGYRLWQMLFD